MIKYQTGGSEVRLNVIKVQGSMERNDEATMGRGSKITGLYPGKDQLVEGQ